MSYVGQRVMQKLLGMVVPEVRTAVLLLLLMWVMEKEQEGAKGDEVEGAGVGGERKSYQLSYRPWAQLPKTSTFSTGHLE